MRLTPSTTLLTLLNGILQHVILDLLVLVVRIASIVLPSLPDGIVDLLVGDCRNLTRTINLSWSIWSYTI